MTTLESILTKVALIAWVVMTCYVLGLEGPLTPYPASLDAPYWLDLME